MAVLEHNQLLQQNDRMLYDSNWGSFNPLSLILAFTASVSHVGKYLARSNQIMFSRISGYFFQARGRNTAQGLHFLKSFSHSCQRFHLNIDFYTFYMRSGRPIILAMLKEMLTLLRTRMSSLSDKNLGVCLDDKTRKTATVIRPDPTL